MTNPLFSVVSLVAISTASILWQGCTADETASGKPILQVVEGVQQLTVIDARPKESLTLFSPEGRELLTLLADELGQAHFAYIPEEPFTLQTGDGGGLPSFDGATLAPGRGYTIRADDRKPVATAGPFRVLGIDDHPPAEHYEKQRLHEGLNYIEMRDGILLSATIWYPDTAICGQGPWPTVVDYSGYSPSNPDDADPGVMIVTQLMCYAGVGVNMRGTGCSGGVYDVFNPAQHADGYDIIEVVARQPFVKYNRVGMVGLSYPGISQLYVAYTNPPHLAAIAPLSVIEDPWRQAWPGGIYNSGFTRQWLAHRDSDARSGGADWATRLIENGDTTCKQNQRLRSQNVNFESFSKALTTFPPAANERRLSNLVPRINVPVFLTGAWQDEQTGSRFATMLDDFTGAPLRRFTMFNGRHPDGYTPLMLARLQEFFDFYIARTVPLINPAIRLIEEPVLKMIFDAPGLRFERDRFAHYESFEEALAAYEAEPEVRVVFESGFGDAVTEAPAARFEHLFAAWPPPARAGVWYLGADGRLEGSAPDTLTAADDGIDRYRHDPEAGEISYIRQDNLWRLLWEWSPAGPGHAISYMADPFDRDTLVVGNGGYANLWFASDATDANIEVSILEVRPDGTEFLVQTGVFAVRHRKGIDPAHSQEFLIEYSYAETEVSYPKAGEFVEVKVPIQPFSHAFRTGTRLRLVIDTPGRDNGYWEFANPEYAGEVIHSVARTAAMASYIKLPLLTDTDIPDDPPTCYSMRGIVCRDFLPLPNTEVTP